jgi:hypothetical protein
MVAMMAGPYLGPTWRAASAARALAPAEAALARGDLEAARSAVLEAARRDGYAARPWLVFGRWLLRHGHAAAALEAYRRADMRKADHWVTRLVLPRLLAEAGHPAEAAQELARAHDFSAHADPWLALEVAWRELPAPRADRIVLGGSDYGAVRGFRHPRSDHRWSRGRAWLRLTPAQPAPSYDVTVDMGSPEPSPLAHPVVTLRGPGAERRFTLAREVRPYTLRVTPPAGEPLVIELRTPTWCRAGEPAEQGVRVDRITVAPVR